MGEKRAGDERERRREGDREEGGGERVRNIESARKDIYI